MFETETDVLAWYERQPRALSKKFLDSLEWREIKNFPLNPAFIPVLVYMRDVESFTEIYYKELLRTPTGKDPVIRKFMDRWNAEEAEHGDVLNRFLAEAGLPSSEHWQTEAKNAIPFQYTCLSRFYPLITNCFGKYFSGTHMAWGALNEMTTLQGYRRLWTLAGHPVLEKLLRAIAQEESLHVRFYWSIARLKLERSGLSRGLANFFIERFWAPVGTGPKPKEESDYVIGTLFKGDEGVSFFDRTVTQRFKRLPGLENSKNVQQRVLKIAGSEA